jgi:hypothetical protein
MAANPSRPFMLAHMPGNFGRTRLCVLFILGTRADNLWQKQDVATNREYCLTCFMLANSAAAKYSSRFSHMCQPELVSLERFDM